MTERKFNYDALPKAEEYGNAPEATERYIYDMRYTPRPCRYCYMNQHGLVDQAQAVFANQSIWQNQHGFPNTNFQTAENLTANPSLQVPGEQLPNPNFGDQGQSLFSNRQGNAENPMMQQFLTEDGQVDIQKMLQTIGQFADTVQQVSPVIKQINDLVRSFRA